MSKPCQAQSFLNSVKQESMKIVLYKDIQCQYDLHLEYLLERQCRFGPDLVTEVQLFLSRCNWRRVYFSISLAIASVRSLVAEMERLQVEEMNMDTSVWAKSSLDPEGKKKEEVKFLSKFLITKSSYWSF